MWILIDYENVGNKGCVGIEKLNKKDHVIVFYNSKQVNKIKQGLLPRASKKGISVEYVKLVQKGKNALDFYISTKVGELLAKQSTRQLFIVSRDRGYQAVIDYYSTKQQDPSVFLVDSIEEIFYRVGQQTLLNDSMSSKELYLYCLKKYGKQVGLFLYEEIKTLNANERYQLLNSYHQKYYVVLSGRKPGIYKRLEDYEENIRGYSCSQGKVFNHLGSALSYFEFNRKNKDLLNKTTLKQKWQQFSSHLEDTFNSHDLAENEVLCFADSMIDSDMNIYAFVGIVDSNGVQLRNYYISKEVKKYAEYGQIVGDVSACKSILKYLLQCPQYSKVILNCKNKKLIKWMNQKEKNGLAIGLYKNLHNLMDKDVTIEIRNS